MTPPQTLEQILAEMQARAVSVPTGMSMVLTKEHLIKALYEDIYQLQQDSRKQQAALKLSLEQRDTWKLRALRWRPPELQLMPEVIEQDNKELADLLRGKA